MISTEPPAGTQAECQSTVTMQVSKGANLITRARPGRRPAGGRRGASSSKLQLIPNVDTRDADEPEGTVIGQEPAAGQRGPARRPGDDRSSPPAPASVIVPDVVGQTEDAAKGALSSRGLGADVVEQDTDERSEDGRVLEQAPGAGGSACAPATR